uniref:Uncharacterized protein n=1 Tax=Arundo donax TaxID=35708 RepID=A0A0A9CKJ4_ARUDO
MIYHHQTIKAPLNDLAHHHLGGLLVVDHLLAIVTVHNRHVDPKKLCQIKNGNQNQQAQLLPKQLKVLSYLMIYLWLLTLFSNQPQCQIQLARKIY